MIRQIHHLLQRVSFLHSPRIRVAFKRLRVEGYKCKMNVRYIRDWLQEKEEELEIPYVWFGVKSAGSWTKPLDFYYNGDLDLICNIFEAEGLKIGYVDINRKWFNILWR